MVGANLLARLFGETPQHDGQASVLEAHAAEAQDALQPGDSLTDTPLSRRQRPLALPGEILTESLAEKVLNAWLQNRHQTLYPLTVNLRALDVGRRALLARMMAFTLHAGVRAPDGRRIATSLAWLEQAGGGEDVAQALRAARDAPDPLRVLLREIGDAGLTAYAYVVSLAATDQRDEAGQLFLDYLAVRLALPANVVRSADRRYRHHAAASVRAVSAP